MLRSLRFRLPAFFLASIVLSGLVAAAIAFRLLDSYTLSRARADLNRESTGLTELYAYWTANSNQPLITNQNDFQFFDNVTRVAGKHTMKAGGSVTLRSREILNADTIVGRFDFISNQTSNCAGRYLRNSTCTTYVA